MARLVLAASGIIVGAAATLGINESIAWPVTALFWLPYLAFRSDRPLAAGVGGGLLAGAAAGLVQALFVAKYVQGHPELADVALAQVRYFVLLSSLAVGGLYGSLAGIGAVGVGRMRGTRATGPPVELEAEDAEE